MLLLNTAKRGLSAVPLKRLRILAVLIFTNFSSRFFANHFHTLLRLFLTSLTNFTSDNFISILDSFALVGFRSSLLSDLGCVLANFFFVDTFNDDLVAVYNGLDVLQDLSISTGVRISQRQNQFLTLFCCFVTYTINLKGFLISFAYTNNHVVDQCSGQAVQGFHLLQIIRTGNYYMAILNLNGPSLPEELSREYL